MVVVVEPGVKGCGGAQGNHSSTAAWSGASTNISVCSSPAASEGCGVWPSPLVASLEIARSALQEPLELRVVSGLRLLKEASRSFALERCHDPSLPGDEHAATSG